MEFAAMPMIILKWEYLTTELLEIVVLTPLVGYQLNDNSIGEFPAGLPGVEQPRSATGDDVVSSMGVPFDYAAPWREVDFGGRYDVAHCRFLPKLHPAGHGGGPLQRRLSPHCGDARPCRCLGWPKAACRISDQ